MSASHRAADETNEFTIEIEPTVRGPSVAVAVTVVQSKSEKANPFVAKHDGITSPSARMVQEHHYISRTIT